SRTGMTSRRRRHSKDVDWAYLAGFTDGDGCISRELSKGTYRYARLRWAQKESSSAVLDEIAKFLSLRGLKVSKRNFSVAYKGHKYPQRELAITNADDTGVALEQMLPYLVLKRDRAIEALSVLRAVQSLKHE